MGWPEALKEIAVTLRKWVAAFFAFWAGRESMKRQNEQDALAEARNEIEADNEAAAIRRDPAELERLRERFRDKED